MLMIICSILLGIFALVSFLLRLLSGTINRAWLYVIEVYGQRYEVAVISATNPRLRKRKGFYIDNSTLVGNRRYRQYVLVNGSIESLLGTKPDLDAKGIPVSLDKLEMVEKTRVMNINWPVWKI